MEPSTAREKLKLIGDEMFVGRVIEIFKLLGYMKKLGK